MIEFISARCPHCGAELEIEKNRSFAYCTYCGTKIIIDNKNEHVFRHIDEAEIKRVEVDREIQMRELDLKEQGIKNRKKMLLIWISVCLVFVGLGVVGIFFENEALEFCFVFAMIVGGYGFIYWYDHPADGSIRLTSSVLNYKKKTYSQVMTELQKLGFKNVQAIPMKDLTFGILYKSDRVDKLIINGEVITSGASYSPDAVIQIMYHSFSGKKGVNYL